MFLPVNKTSCTLDLSYSLRRNVEVFIDGIFMEDNHMMANDLQNKLYAWFCLIWKILAFLTVTLWSHSEIAANTWENMVEQIILIHVVPVKC